MNISILHQDSDITVIEKPSGVVVNRSATVTEPTIQDWFGEYLAQQQVSTQLADWQSLVSTDFQDDYGSPAQIFAERGGIVHRLDKETSGVMVLANNPGALVALLQQFRTRQVKKMYTCLVHGKFHFIEGQLNLPLGRSSQNRTKFAIDASGRSAMTRYQVKSFYPQLDAEAVVSDLTQKSQDLPRDLRKNLQKSYQGFSFVECWPQTGRTHQIRVHMASVQHPIVADQTYLGKKRLRLDETWCPRLFLHATELEFTHPRTQQKIGFQVSLAADLQRVLTDFLAQQPEEILIESELNERS